MRIWFQPLLASLCVFAPAFSVQADVPTAADLAETREIVWSDPAQPELLEKAGALGSATAIYEFVRNDFEFALYDGSRSNSTNIFINRRGNDVDLASTLLAMLRSQGVPARYAAGSVSVSYEELQNWIEIPNALRASTTLLLAGFQNVSISATRTTFDHAWVEAFVPLERYRGNDSANPVDCMATPSSCTWVHLDPSFKQRKYRDAGDLVDLSDVVFFDYESYFHAEDESYPQPDGIDRREKNPLEVYEEMILKHLHETPGLEDKTLEDVVYRGEIIEETHGLLPTSAPFRFDPLTVNTYSSVDAHDADASQFDWTKTVSFTVEFPRIPELAGLTLSGGSPIPLSELASKELIVAYESTNFDNLATPKQLVARLGDEIHETIFTLVNSSFTSNAGSGTLSGDLPDVDTQFDVTLTMDGNGNTTTLSAVYPDLVLGGYFLVATGGEFSGFGEVRRSAERILQNLEENPVLDDGSGVLYVDQNKDGVINAGEPTLLEDAETQRVLTGGVLAIAKDLYYAQVRDQLERLSKLQRTVMPPQGFLGVVSSVHDVRAVDGTAFSVTPVGLLVDMKGLLVVTPYKIDQDGVENGRTFRLGGHILSSLEHEIWQELTGFEAISTMKGIQRTLGDGGTLLELDEGQTQVSIATAMTEWGFGQSLPSGTSSADLPLFSHNIWFPRTTSTSVTKTLSVLRETVTSSNSDLEKRGWELEIFRENNQSGNAYGVVHEELLRAIYENYTHFQGFPSNTSFLNPPHNLAVQVLGFSISGCTNANTTGAAVSNYPGCFAALMNRDELKGYRDYLDFFDKNQGFAVSAHLYRDTDLTLNIKATSLAPLRDEIVLGADSNNDGVPDGDSTTEIVIPSILAKGDLLDFAVWVQRYLDDTGSEYSASYIINRAGGGYITGSDPIFTSDWYDTSWNNELYNDVSLNPYTNNSIFTPSTWDPIATVSGNVFHDEEDLQIRSRGIDYLFTRTYNSGPTQADSSGVPMGHKWSHSYNMRLIAKDYGKEPNSPAAENSDNLVSSITYVEERGGESIFGVSGDPGPMSSWNVDNPRGNFDSLDLSQGASQLYTLRFRNGTEYVFGGANLANVDAVARLLFIRDPYGNELSFSYTGSNLTRIQDNLGLSGRTGLTLSYFGNGRLAQIADWSGRTWSYTYDADGNLASVEDPLGNTTNYAYGSEPSLHRLTKVSKPVDRDGNGSPDVEVRFDYYANGRGFSNENSFGKGEQVDYDLFRKRTRVTDPRGFVFAHYYNKNGELTKLTQPDGGIETFLHTAEGRRWSRTDALGRATQYSYCTARSLDGCNTDTAGNITLETDALGQTTEYDYNSALFDQVTRIEDKNGDARSFSYYTADNSATGAKRGKVHQIRLSKLGSSNNLLTHIFTYNPDGTLRTQVEYIIPGNAAHKRNTTYTYSDNGLNLTEVLTTGLDGTSQKTTFDYDSLGRVLQTHVERRTSPTNATPIALTTSYAYDAADRVIRVTDPLGNQAETDYDANGNPIETRYIGVDPQTGVLAPARVIERLRYDDADRVIETEDVEGNITSFGYDAGGNRVRITDATGVSRFLEYDSRNRVVAIKDKNGHTTRNRYDQSGRLLSTTDANGKAVSYEYDALGRTTAIRNALGHHTTLFYDANGNPTGQIDANANADPSNSALVNSSGQSLTRVYDELSRIVEVVDALEGSTRFEYDLFGNQRKVTDAKGQVTEFVYDDLGRLTEVIDPIIESPDKRETYEYDEVGNVIEATDRAGNTVRTTYDLLNRPVSWHHLSSGEIETARYDAFGNLTELAGTHVTYSFGYDTRNLLTSKLDSRLGRSLLYEYDPAGRATKKIDYQGEETFYQYDGTGRLVAERNAAYLQVSYHYDPAGRLLNRILSSGAKTDYKYDAANRLSSITNWSADDSLVHTRLYVRDAVGNATATYGTDGTIGYSYDALHRLSIANSAGTALDESFGYDAVGNRLTKTTASGTFNYSYGAGNRLNEIRLAGSNALVNSFVYDDNGAMLEKRDANGSAIWSFTRDDRRRVVGMSGSGLANGTGSLQYDIQGARVRHDDSAGTRLFHLEGDHLEAVYDGAGALREKYLRGVVIDEVVNGYLLDAEGKLRNLSFHHDHLNSVVGLSGHSGDVEEITLFSAFGETLSTSGSTENAMRYTGRRQVDGSGGLYYYRARYYDPEIGRFLSEDPLGFGAGINFYAYVENNPINANDPTGECPWCIGAVLGGAVGAVTGAATAHISGGDWREGAVVGGLTGAFIGGTLGAGTSWAVGKVASDGVAAFAGGVASGYGGGVAGSAGPQIYNYGPDSVDWSVANNAGIAGAAVASLPAMAMASATTATAVGGAPLYTFAQQQAIGATLGFYEFAAGSATNLLFSDYLTQPTPYTGAPDSFQVDFPSSSLSDPIFDVYCSPKC
jgi:RHS repeat-associated protein